MSLNTVGETFYELRPYNHTTQDDHVLVED